MEFSSKTAIIGEPDPTIAEMMRAALARAGFGRAEVHPSLVKLHQALRRETPALLVLSANFDGEDSSFITSGLRAGKLGNDPFAVIIVLMAGVDGSRARQIANSGADDALLLPVPADVLVGRVSDLAGPRKPFVVTCDYIGPERRSAPRPEQPSARQIAVPNPLAAMAAPDYAACRDAAREMVLGERVVRLVVQIGWLVNAVAEAVATGQPMASFLFRLDEVGKELVGRISDPGRIDAVRRLLALARAIRTSTAAIPASAVAELTAAAQGIS